MIDGSEAPATAGRVCMSQASSWVCEGEVWALSHAGLTVRLRTRKGLRHLAKLLERPNHPVHVLDLLQDKAASTPYDARQHVCELSPRSARFEVRDPLSDAHSRAAYRQRMLDIEAELAEAERDADLGRCQALEAEKSWLLQALLARSCGINVTVERARKAVYNRIREAVSAIDRLHPALARHLVVSVRTGAHCVYKPDLRVRWSLIAA